LNLSKFSILIFSLFILNCDKFADSKLGDKHLDSVNEEMGYYGKDISIFIVSSSCRENKSEILIFVHGSPGSWSDYKKYLQYKELQNKYCILVMDRPGFGESQNSGSVPDIFLQSQMINHSINHFFESNGIQNQNITVVGHSYGGPIVIDIASINKNVKRIILISSPDDPNLEEVRWYNKLASSPVLNYILPMFLKNSNEEMLTLRGQLQTLSTKLKVLSQEIIVLHGKKDYLVPFENVKYIKEQALNAKIKIIELDNEGHFIPWTKFQLVVDIILNH